MPVSSSWDRQHMATELATGLASVWVGGMRRWRRRLLQSVGRMHHFSPRPAVLLPLCTRQ